MEKIFSPCCTKRSNKKKKRKKYKQYLLEFIHSSNKNVILVCVSAYENGKSLVKSAVVGIEEFGNFEDLLKAALHQKELFFEGVLIKVDFQCNDSSVWHPILNGL